MAFLYTVTKHQNFGNESLRALGPHRLKSLPEIINATSSMIYINSFNKMVSGQKYTLIKGPVSGMRQFLAIESPLKALKNAFYFMLKALFVLKIFKFLP